MRYSNLTPFLAGACLSIAALTSALAQTAESARPVSDRPTGTRPLSASVAENTVQVFRHKDFSGDMIQVSDVTGKQSWTDNDFVAATENKASSLRWNLPRGVVVTLFEDDACMGRQLTVWGSGEIASLTPWKLDNKVSGWAWNYVGGVKSPAAPVLAGRTPRPKYARVAESMPADSAHLFKERSCKGKTAPVEHVTSQSQGVFQPIPPAIGKSASSVRWKLPDGAVVVFAANQSGETPQVVIWGDGEFDAFNYWQMNDKVTHWAWYNVGE